VTGPAPSASARWKDLCLDANDQALVGEFWAAVLHQPVETSPGKLSIDPLAPGGDHQRIWVNAVEHAPPRAEGGKQNRLHLDVYATSIADLVTLGATVLEPAEETGFKWTVMADPEGGEFCAFLRSPAEVPAYRLHGVVVDSLDPAAQAAWWGRVFGVPVKEWPGEDFSTLERATPDPVLTLDFVPVPEPRVGPNRVHWDVVGEVDDLLAAGATHLWDTEHWTVLADPEGNEFCVFAER
jgi:hypothetical protein